MKHRNWLRFGLDQARTTFSSDDTPCESDWPKVL
jgi:hypothetical protein